MKTNTVSYRKKNVDGLNLFYREAGSPDAPSIVLLHGFPTSSHMFRNLIPILAPDYHVIAPDLPGFGFSDAPDHKKFSYTFENIARIVGDFVDELGVKTFAVYVFDYGAPTGLRIALRYPHRVFAIISQNGNAYTEGLGKDAWAPMRKYWENPTKENREALKSLFTFEATKYQYHHGVTNPDETVAPEAVFLDTALLERPESAEIQLDLIGDYKSNVELYPQFQAYFRKEKPPILCVWGKNDPFFIPAGAEAYKRDNPNAKIVFYDTGHFALETHFVEIGTEIRSFLRGAEPTVKRV
ncbi:MAG TPA: alpha/beta hydrolase [Chthoniobacterales bacterium]